MIGNGFDLNLQLKLLHRVVQTFFLESCNLAEVLLDFLRVIGVVGAILGGINLQSLELVDITVDSLASFLVKILRAKTSFKLVDLLLQFVEVHRFNSFDFLLSRFFVDISHLVLQFLNGLFVPPKAVFNSVDIPLQHFNAVLAQLDIISNLLDLDALFLG